MPALTIAPDDLGMPPALCGREDDDLIFA